MSDSTTFSKGKKSKTSPKSTLVESNELTVDDSTNNSIKEAGKKKNKKRKEIEDDAPQTILEETAIASDSKQIHAESDKKRKKKKRTETSIQDGTAEDQGIIKDAIETHVNDSQTKKQKKRKTSEEGEPMTIVGKDTETTFMESEKLKKKKKRKHEEREDDTPDIHTSTVSKSKKEKRRRNDEPATTTSVPSTSTELPSSPSNDVSPAPNLHKETWLVSPSPAEATAFLLKHSITIHTPPGVPKVLPIIKFSQLDTPTELQSSFAGFKEPTPIQACTWPPALEGRDVVGIAETGSGKTLAFGIPALCRLIKSPSMKSLGSGKSTVSVLVVAPTRELAIQTHETLSALGKPFGIASVAVFGGVPKDPQVKMLKNANKGKDGMFTRIIVGTPGRILDLMQEGVCDLSEVNYLVLDEADRMLDKGFENDIRNIISSTRPAVERQTMMFSATWPEAVRRLASTFQRDPIRVTVGSDDLTANSRVEQSVEVFDDARSKDQRLLNLLKSLSHKKTTKTGASEARILVFALYKKEASRVEQMLQRQGYSVGALHGDMSQNARMETLENFKNGTTGLMVATDVAARGLDIPNVGAVINYTFPLTIEDYIHRIGRTGRGGKTGKSITFFTGDTHEKALAGEFARVLREGGFDYEGLKKFPMTIKKKEHSAYGAFFRDDIPVPKGPTKIVF